MALPIWNDTNTAHLIELHRTGMQVPAMSKALGLSVNTIYRRLSALGLPLNRQRTWRDLDGESIAREYRDGISVLELATAHNIARASIELVLADQGVTKRTAGEQMLILNSKRTPEQRKAQAAAAHEAKRGRPNSEEALERAAIARYRDSSGNVGPSELLMARWLTDRGLPVDAQIPVGKYNCDIGVGDRFAVELFGGNWHATGTHAQREPERAEYIMGRGISLCYVWDQRRCRLQEAAADQVVSYFQLACLDPSPVGQYWVVRGDGQLLATGRGQLDHGAIPISQSRS